MSSFQEILRKLEKGELPEELDFRPKEQTPDPYLYTVLSIQSSNL